ncbi:MAG: hypothetical protein KF814_08970 [Nitrospiraceae bacterium]|nr:hypothetical protein [Nitrospiraceae bacterium]
MGQTSGQQKSAGTVEQLRDEFRERLEVFYRGLKLAPPYDSVEKALARLTAKLKSLSPEDLQRLSSDSTLRWVEYRAAFVESGLSQKHRGIIAGLARSRQNLDLPSDFDQLLEIYLSRP